MSFNSPYSHHSSNSYNERIEREEVQEKIYGGEDGRENFKRLYGSACWSGSRKFLRAKFKFYKIDSIFMFFPCKPSKLYYTNFVHFFKFSRSLHARNAQSLEQLFYRIQSQHFDGCQQRWKHWKLRKVHGPADARFRTNHFNILFSNFNLTIGNDFSNGQNYFKYCLFGCRFCRKNDFLWCFCMIFYMNFIWFFSKKNQKQDNIGKRDARSVASSDHVDTIEALRVRFLN